MRPNSRLFAVTTVAPIRHAVSAMSRSFVGPSARPQHERFDELDADTSRLSGAGGVGFPVKP